MITGQTQFVMVKYFLLQQIVLRIGWLNNHFSDNKKAVAFATAFIFSIIAIMKKNSLYLLLFIILSHAIVAQTNNPIFKKTKIEDSDTTTINMAQHVHNKPFIIVLLSPECPIAQKYMPILRGMTNLYTSIEFYQVFTKWDDWDSIQAFKKEYPLSITALKDKTGQLVKNINAKATPEVFFFNEHYVLLYRGAIDNWFFNLGKHRQEATECYLEEAINAYLKGEKIKIKKTNAVGCIIEK
jgi:hypothetical protein